MSVELSSDPYSAKEMVPSTSRGPLAGVVCSDVRMIGSCALATEAGTNTKSATSTTTIFFKDVSNFLNTNGTFAILEQFLEIEWTGGLMYFTATLMN